MTPLDAPFPTDEDCPNPSPRRRKKAESGSSGWTKFDNDLHDALFMRDLTLRELKILLCIVRESTGRNRTSTKPELDRTTIAQMVGFNRNHCYTVLSGLVEKRIVLQRGSTFRVNPNLGLWKCSILGSRSSTDLVDDGNENTNNLDDEDLPNRLIFSTESVDLFYQIGRSDPSTMQPESAFADPPKDMKDMKDSTPTYILPTEMNLIGDQQSSFSKIENGGGGKSSKLTPRQLGTNPRAQGTNPRAKPHPATWADQRLARSLSKTLGKQLARVQVGILSRLAQRKLDGLQAVAPDADWHLGPDAWAKALVLALTRACDHCLPIFRDGPEPASRVAVVIDKAQQFLPDIVRELRGEK